MTPISRLFGGNAVTSRPPMSIVPEVGTSNPARHINIDVFPEPLGPSTDRNSPASTLKFALSTAVTLLPYRLTRFVISTWAPILDIKILRIEPCQAHESGPLNV